MRRAHFFIALQQFFMDLSPARQYHARLIRDGGSLPPFPCETLETAPD